MTRALLVLALLAAAAGADEIVVRVTFAEQPVEGAGISVLKPDDAVTFDASAWAPDAVSDAAGVASVDAAPGGRILVYVPGHELVVAAAQGTTVDVPLRPERVFSGRVVDGTGAAVAGARVTLQTTFNRPASFPARSDGEGSFHVYGLWFDNYTVAIAAEGFVDGKPAAVTEADSGRAFALTRAGAVAGRVMDAAGRPRPNSVVLVGAERVRTDGQGGFVQTDLPPGPYRIRPEPPWGGELRVTLDEGETAAGLQLLALPPGRLRFRTVDAAGEPIPNVLVRHEPEARSDKGGVVELAVTPGETTHLVLESTHGFEHDFPPVESGEVLDAGDVVLDPPPVVDVRVWLPDGGAAPEGRVDDTPLRDGVASTQGLDQVWVFVPGYPDTLVRIEPPGPVDVRLPVPQWIRGIVLGPDGGPVVGAAVEGRGIEAESDGEGRFRLGPYAPGDEVHVIAVAGDLRSRGHTVVGFEGELEVRLIEREPEFVRGRVLRGDAPVRRFRIGGRDFVDEEGRFEALVDRTRRGHLIVSIGSRGFPFDLPPPGEDLIASLPVGTVTVAAAGEDVAVVLRTAAGADEATARSENGTALFRDVAPGAYSVRAPGFAAADVVVAEDAPVRVTLAPEARATLRVRAWGREEVLSLRPGWHRHVSASRPELEVVGFSIAPGEELLLDLMPAASGSLMVTGPAHGRVSLAGEAAVPFILHASLGDAGEHVFDRLPPGRYRIGLAARDREVDVAPGRVSVVRLSVDVQDLRGRVMLLDGRPAQGAEVRFASSQGGAQFFKGRTDLLGRFAFEDAPRGDYEFRASLDGYAPAAAPAVDGAVLVLAPSASGRARLVGNFGEALAGVWLLVDGDWQRTDPLGRFAVHRAPARVSLDLDGHGSVRDLPVEEGGEIRLVPGAALRVLHQGVEPERVAVRVAGERWQPLRGSSGRPPPEGEIRLEDLPEAAVEVEVAPPEEGAESRVIRARLVSGEVTVIDLR